MSSLQESRLYYALIYTSICLEIFSMASIKPSLEYIGEITSNVIYLGNAFATHLALTVFHDILYFYWSILYIFLGDYFSETCSNILFSIHLSNWSCFSSSYSYILHINIVSSLSILYHLFSILKLHIQSQTKRAHPDPFVISLLLTVTSSALLWTFVILHKFSFKCLQVINLCKSRKLNHFCEDWNFRWFTSSHQSLFSLRLHHKCAASPSQHHLLIHSSVFILISNVEGTWHFFSLDTRSQS